MLDSKFTSEGLVIAAPFVTVFFAGISAALFYYSYALYRRTKNCPREVVVGSDGFLYGGYYTSWNVIGTYLAGAKLIPGNIPAIEFDIQVWGKYGYSSRPLRIPVPAGYENEAAKVVSELSGLISTAQSK